MKSCAEFISEVRIRGVMFAMILTGCLILLSGHALAVDISDDFDANEPNKTIWGTGIKKGDGLLSQKQGHLVYTVLDATTEDSFKRLLRARGPYYADWDAEMDLYNNTNPSQNNQVNSFGIDIYHCEDPEDWLYAELYASHYGGPPSRKGFYMEFATNDGFRYGNSNGVLEGDRELTGSVRIEFDSVGKILRVYYAYNGGDEELFGTFGISAAGGGNIGNGDWAMTDADQFCLKVYGYSEHMGVSGGKMYADTFVANGFVPQQIMLLDPNGREILPAKQEDYPITWDAPSNSEKFTLKYSVDDGFTWKTINTDVTDKTYPWTVPVPVNNKRKCLMKVIGYDKNGVKIGSDVSDASFTIEVIKLTSPNQGEPALTSGGQHLITWTTNATIAKVDHITLSYTLNDGLDWRTIDTSADPSDDGSFLWKLPSITRTKSKCKVKIVLKDASGNTLGSDVSDGVFTIQLPSP